MLLPLPIELRTSPFFTLTLARPPRTRKPGPRVPRVNLTALQRRSAGNRLMKKGYSAEYSPDESPKVGEMYHGHSRGKVVRAWRHHTVPPINRRDLARAEIQARQDRARRARTRTKHRCCPDAPPPEVLIIAARVPVPLRRKTELPKLFGGEWSDRDRHVRKLYTVGELPQHTAWNLLLCLTSLNKFGSPLEHSSSSAAICSIRRFGLV